MMGCKELPTLETPYKANSDTTVYPSHFPIPGMGVLPIQWSFIRDKVPVLVDTGMPVERE